MLIFTRLLYCYDEVCINLLISILEKKDFNKSMFWAAEIFCSGFEKETWNIIWKIYYEFYALTNPYIEKKIIEYQKKAFSQKKTISKFKKVMLAVQLFYNNKPSCAIFIINNMYKKPLINKSFDELSKKIKKQYNKTENIKLFIKYLFICSKKYPNQMEKLAILLTKKKIQKNSYFKNIFLKIICHLFRFKYNLNDSSKLKQEKIILTKNDIDYIKKIIKFEIKSKPYKTLQYWRYYNISEYTSAFQLEREKINLKKSFWYHWEYYAMGCLFWNEKIKKYKGKKNKNKKEIEFPCEDLFESFYECYNYDIDELDKKTQEKSIKELNHRLTVPDMLRNVCVI